MEVWWFVTLFAVAFATVYLWVRSRAVRRDRPVKNNELNTLDKSPNKTGEPKADEILEELAPPPMFRGVSDSAVRAYGAFSQPRKTTNTAWLDEMASVLNTLVEEDEKEEAALSEQLPSTMIRSSSEGTPRVAAGTLSLAELRAWADSFVLSLPSPVAEEKKSLPLPVEEKKEVVLPRSCGICFSEESEEDRLVSVCPKKCLDVFCRDCLDRQFTMKVEESYGACPLLRCPGSSCGAFLKFDAWKIYVKPEVEARYNQNAQALLSLQCASCHTRGTLLANNPPIPEGERLVKIEEMAKLLEEKGATTVHVSLFKTLLEDYINGNDNPRMFIDNLVASFGGNLIVAQQSLDRALENVDQTVAKKNAKENAELASLNEAKNELQAKRVVLENKLAVERDDIVRRRIQYAVDTILASIETNRVKIIQLEQKLSRFRATYNANEGVETKRLNLSRAREQAGTVVQPLIPSVLSLVSDVQRRAFLQLRFVLVFPTVSTLCCNRLHCFKCHTIQHPPGVSCQEAASHMSLEIRACPQCNMSITKGDGCNSVRCVCGHSFGWSSALIVH